MKYFAFAALLSACAVTGASAHITLAVPQATIGASYRATFRVSHGCAGAATTKIRVQVPDGVIAKPMPHAGWTLTTVKGPYATPYTSEGVTLTEGTREVDWTGTLPDDQYDEFVINMTLLAALKPNTILYFPTVQECEGSTVRWIEVPPAGKGTGDVKYPPPGVQLVPKP